MRWSHQFPLHSSVIVWYTGLSIMSLSTNVLASGLISFRIYQAGYQITRTGGHIRAKAYRGLLWTYLESGSIYPTVLIIALALYFSGSPFGWLMITNTTQICGMVPTLMILAILLAGRSLSESTMTELYTHSNSYTMHTRSHQSNAHEFVATTSLSQLADIESGSEPQAAYKSTALIPSESHATHDIL
jgi:hypothetical protein